MSPRARPPSSQTTRARKPAHPPAPLDAHAAELALPPHLHLHGLHGAHQPREERRRNARVGLSAPAGVGKHAAEPGRDGREAGHHRLPLLRRSPPLHQRPGDLHHPPERLSAVGPAAAALPPGNVAVGDAAEPDEGYVGGAVAVGGHLPLCAAAGAAAAALLSFPLCAAAPATAASALVCRHHRRAAWSAAGAGPRTLPCCASGETPLPAACWLSEREGSDPQVATCARSHRQLQRVGCLQSESTLRISVYIYRLSQRYVSTTAACFYVWHSIPARSFKRAGPAGSFQKAAGGTLTSSAPLTRGESHFLLLTYHWETHQSCRFVLLETDPCSSPEGSSLSLRPSRTGRAPPAART